MQTYELRMQLIYRQKWIELPAGRKFHNEPLQNDAYDLIGRFSSFCNRLDIKIDACIEVASIVFNCIMLRSLRNKNALYICIRFFLIRTYRLCGVKSGGRGERQGKLWDIKCMYRRHEETATAILTEG